jgi:hypothetical protein
MAEYVSTERRVIETFSDHIAQGRIWITSFKMN